MKHTKLIVSTASALLLASASLAQTVFTPGVLRHQVWSNNNTVGRANPSRIDIENGLAGLPDSDTTDLTAFETVPDQMDNYGERVCGLFVPPSTGNYIFIINSDDESDLFLNPTGTSAAGKQLIAQEPSWSNPLNWTTAGAGDAKQKNSSTWKNAGNVSPWKDGIQLTGGQKYWIEAVHHEGGNGDNLAVTFYKVGENAPATGTASAMTGDLIGYGYTIPASLKVLTQVTNITVYAGTEASFSFGVEDPLPDALEFQWYRDNVVVSNATGSSYTFLATTADNGATFKCEVKVPDSYGSSIKVTSATATLTVKPDAQSVIVKGYLKAETFPYVSRQQIEDGNVAPSTNIFVVPSFELPVDKADHYGRRVSGWFLPPVSGKYVFFINSDDDSDLFLSTDANAGNKRLIAQGTVWSGSRNWLTSGDPANSDATAAALKRSDQWTPDEGVTTPYAAGIDLTAGSRYYIEAAHREGDGGDNLAVTYKLVGDEDPKAGDAPKLAGSNIECITAPATKLQFSTQPVNAKVFDQQSVVFTAATTWDGELTPIYQWYRTQNGTTAAVAGAVDPTLRFTANVAADNGAQFFVVATTSLSATSQVATLTVQQAVFEPGMLKVEFFPNQTRAVVEAGTAPDPSYTTTASAFDLGTASSDNYARRVSGLFMPPSSGKYVFFVAADDDTDLYLSTDATPYNKQLIAQEAGWANARRNWLTPGTDGGSTSSQKRSDQWSPDSGASIPFANGIQLNTGSKYYLEAVQHNGSGGDYVGVTYMKVGETEPLDNDASKLTGNVIGFDAPVAGYVAFTQHPQSVTAAPGTTATFSAQGISDSPITINGNANVTVLYQWYKDGTAIPGATSATYTTPILLGTDAGTHSIYAAIRALGIAVWSNSTPATLTVTADPVAPTITAAELYSLNGEQVLGISFSERMDLASLASATYTVAGATVTAVTVNTNNGRSVYLTVSGTPTGAVTVSGAKDVALNGVAAGSSTPVHTLGLISQDIGNSGDPAYPSFFWVDATNAFTVMAQGSDIWGAADGFNFSYEQKTGDFDVAVRQKRITHTSNWAKAGLMVRESLEPGSRNWNIVNDPRSDEGINAPDNSGFGANVVECNTRYATSGESQSWGNAPAKTPAYPNAWLRLTRVGQVLTAYHSDDGVNWTVAGTQDPATVGDMTALPASVYVGVCVTAHNNDQAGADPLLYYNLSEFADYSSSFVLAPPKPTLALALEGTAWKITYTGTLQASDTADGQYNDVAGASSPYTVNTATGSKFYRARR